MFENSKNPFADIVRQHREANLGIPAQRAAMLTEQELAEERARIQFETNRRLQELAQRMIDGN